MEELKQLDHLLDMLTEDAHEARQRSPVDLAALIIEARALKDQVKRIKGRVERYYDFVTTILAPERMAELGLDSANVTGQGRLQLSGQLRVNTIKDNKPALHAWLQEQGLGELLQADINPSTLKAVISERLKNPDAGPLPDDDIVTIVPYQRATVVSR